MPSPSSSLATLRPDLAGSMEEFDLAADRQGFIAYQVLRAIEAGAQAGVYGKIAIEELLKKRDHLARAPGAGYSRDTFKFTTGSYACHEYGHEEPVDDRQARMYRNYFDAEVIAAARARDAVLRGAEIRAADLIFNATTWNDASLSTAITLEWDENHYTTAIPITDVNAAAQKVWDGTGIWPNALVICRKTFRHLRNIDQIKDAIASAGAGDSVLQRRITLAQLAQAFDLDYILVAGSAKNTADEGQSASLSSIWNDEYAMVCRVAETADISEPCIGRVIHWADDGSSIGGTMESYRDETVRGDIIRARHDVDEIVMYTELGHLLSNVTTH
jgi:hypothetical protein